MVVMKYSDIVESNGKTIKQNNMAIAHKFNLGDLVEIDITLFKEREGCLVDLKGKCKLYVVMQGRDCDGTPLYCLADIPVIYPKDAKILSHEQTAYESVAEFCKHGYSEDNMKLVGKAERMYNNIREYFGY